MVSAFPASRVCQLAVLLFETGKASIRAYLAQMVWKTSIEFQRKLTGSV